MNGNANGNKAGNLAVAYGLAGAAMRKFVANNLVTDTDSLTDRMKSGL